jgi:hypothetical protein
MSLIINRVRFKKKKPKQITLPFKADVTKKKIINFCGKLSSPCLSFFLSASTVAAYNFTTPTCTLCIKPHALNAESQHFIPGFNP